MVEEVSHNDKIYYQCEACRYYYKTKKLAQECEDFCNKHKSCSLEITKYSVKFK